MELKLLTKNGKMPHLPVGVHKVTELQTRASIKEDFQLYLRFSTGQKHSSMFHMVTPDNHLSIRKLLVYLGFAADGTNDKLLVNQLMHKTLLRTPIDATVKIIYRNQINKPHVDTVQHNNYGIHTHRLSEVEYVRQQWASGVVRPDFKNILREAKYWYATVYYGDQLNSFFSNDVEEVVSCDSLQIGICVNSTLVNV